MMLILQSLSFKMSTSSLDTLNFVGLGISKASAFVNNGHIFICVWALFSPPVPSSVVIPRSNIVTYYINDYRN